MEKSAEAKVEKAAEAKTEKAPKHEKVEAKKEESKPISATITSNQQAPAGVPSTGRETRVLFFSPFPPIFSHFY